MSTQADINIIKNKYFELKPGYTFNDFTESFECLHSTLNAIVRKACEDTGFLHQHKIEYTEFIDTAEGGKLYCLAYYIYKVEPEQEYVINYNPNRSIVNNNIYDPTIGQIRRRFEGE